MAGRILHFTDRIVIALDAELCNFQILPSDMFLFFRDVEGKDALVAGVDEIFLHDFESKVCGLGQVFRFLDRFCGKRNRRDTEENAFHGACDGTAVKAVAAVIESVVHAGNDEIRLVITEPVFQPQLAAVCCRAVAGQYRNIFSIAFLLPHAQVRLERKGTGAGASPAVRCNDRHPAQPGKSLCHFNNTGRFKAVVICHEYMHSPPVTSKKSLKGCTLFRIYFNKNMEKILYNFGQELIEACKKSRPNE
jgi:hypothetical protein